MPMAARASPMHSTVLCIRHAAAIKAWCWCMCTAAMRQSRLHLHLQEDEVAMGCMLTLDASLHCSVLRATRDEVDSHVCEFLDLWQPCFADSFTPQVVWLCFAPGCRLDCRGASAMHVCQHTLYLFKQAVSLCVPSHEVKRMLMH